MRKITVRQSELSYRVPLYSPDFPFIVLWSQKAGCTSVVKWFFVQIGILKRAMRHHNWVHNYENEVFKARDGYMDACVSAVNQGTGVLKFVRNPYTRLYSGYLETCRRHVLSDPHHWSTTTRKSVLRYLRGFEGDLEYTYSFHQFVDWFVNQDPQSLDPHLSAQYQNWEKNVSLRYIRLEDSDNPFLALEREYGLKDTSMRPVVFKSGHHHIKQPRSLSEQRKSLELGIPIQKSGKFEFYEASPYAIETSPSGHMIRKALAADFAAYAYDHDS